MNVFILEEHATLQRPVHSFYIPMHVAHSMCFKMRSNTYVGVGAFYLKLYVLAKNHLF